MIFLARYWRVLTVAAVVAVVLFGISRLLSKADSRGYQRARAEMAVQVARANAESAALEQRQRIQSQQAAQAWESKRNELQGQVDHLLRAGVSVRLCKHTASAAPVSAAAGTAGSFDGASSSAVDAVQAGRDVGAELVQLGAECERYRSQLIELQRWVAASR